MASSLRVALAFSRSMSPAWSCSLFSPIFSMKNSWIARSRGEWYSTQSADLPSRPARPAARQVVVQDEADVGLVDAHPKCVGGYDDRARVLHEALLTILARELRHAGV